MRGSNSLVAAADRALYTGELAATGWHSHAAPVLLVGLSGPFALHRAGAVVSCRSAVVDIGVPHAFDPCGERVALVYLEPDAPEARGLRLLLAREQGVLVDPVRPVADRGFTDQRLASFDLGSLLRFRWPEAPPPDARVQRALALLRAGAEGPLRRDAASAVAHLSASRFNHLFRQEMGVSFRSYRVWSQLRSAMTAIGPSLNLAHAAQEGAFSDAAHFSRTFRQAFGMSPSSVLKPLAEVRRL